MTLHPENQHDSQYLFQITHSEILCQISILHQFVHDDLQITSKNFELVSILPSQLTQGFEY
jgi:hypothetical protein